LLLRGPAEPGATAGDRGERGAGEPLRGRLQPQVAARRGAGGGPLAWARGTPTLGGARGPPPSHPDHASGAVREAGRDPDRPPRRPAAAPALADDVPARRAVGQARRDHTLTAQPFL